MHRTYSKIINFIKYHNAFTLIFVIVFLGFGMSYAASPAVRDAVYSSKETLVSIDNTQIVSADLDNFNFNLKINSITEDKNYYYADYSYQTLTIQDGAWQNTEVQKVLKVSKESLEGDLGLYVAQQLAENIKSEQYYLKRVQKLEKGKGETQKIVATQYTGLVGKFLNPKEEVIEGYSPVIPEATPTPSPTSEGFPIFPSPVMSSVVPSNPPSTFTPTPVPETTPTPIPESTPASTSTPTPEPSATPEITPTPTPTPTPEATSTPTPEITPTPESTPTPEVTPTPTPEQTPEATPTP